MIKKSDNKIIEIKTPGKLFLTGEWSVLEKNNPCIVLAINKYVKAKIGKNKTIIIHTKDSNVKNIKAIFFNNELLIKSPLSEREKITFSFTKNAVERALQYLCQNNVAIKHFSLSLASEISKLKLKTISQELSRDGSYTKVGLGSSSATVVAIISALLKFHDHEIESLKAKKIIFKLSSIAHYGAQNKIGSCADIAACAYKQPIMYKMFDATWLEQQVKENALVKIINKKWPNLQITPIRLPKELILCAGFVGYGSSTQKLIPKILHFKKSNQKEYNKTIISITNVVEKLIKSLNSYQNNQQKKILNLIKKNRELLKQVYPQLETYELTKLINIANKYNAAAKFSGAGAGDCGIAICFDKNIALKIKDEWKKEGIHPLDIETLK